MSCCRKEHTQLRAKQPGRSALRPWGCFQLSERRSLSVLSPWVTLPLQVSLFCNISKFLMNIHTPFTWFPFCFEIMLFPHFLLKSCCFLHFPCWTDIGGVPGILTANSDPVFPGLLSISLLLTSSLPHSLHKQFCILFIHVIKIFDFHPHYWLILKLFREVHPYCVCRLSTVRHWA